MTAAPHPSIRPPSGIAPPALFVREAGQGAPLVLLHGLASSSRYWEPHFGVLGRTYQVLAPDLLGFGRSPKPPGALYDPQEHLAAIEAAILPRIGGPFTLAGHSMGTILALHLALAHPELVRRLLLISLPVVGDCAWGHHPDGGHRRLHHFAVHTRAGQVLFGAGIRAAAPIGAVVWPRLRRDIPRGAAEDALRAGWLSYWRTLEATVYGADVPAMFAALSTPPVLIHGARDFVAPVEPVRALARSRSDVRYIEIADAHHNPAVSHPRVFYEALAGSAEEA